jgi:ATP-binding cassette, subfamily F, member 3
MLLQAKQLTKRFNGKKLFTNINLKVNENNKIALVGRNGAGKSTLVKMLLGNLPIDEGEVITKKHLTIGYLAQNTGLKSNRTIIDEMKTVFANVIKLEKKMHAYEKQMSQPEIIQDAQKLAEVTKTYDQIQTQFTTNNGFNYQAEIKSVLNGFGFTSDYYQQKISNLSGGQQTQLAMAKLLLEKRDLLILDEPTNHIDVKTISWLEDYLKNYHGALLIISHDRFFMDKIVNEVYDLSHGQLTHYIGNYSEYSKKKQLRYHQQMKAYEKQQKQIHDMQDFVEKNIVRASTTKRAQARRKQLAKMNRIQKPQQDNKSAHLHFSPKQQSGNVVLTLRDAAIGYDEKPLSQNINLNIKRNQAIALIGPNGIGKSTLVKSIIHKLPMIKGELTLGTGVQIGYYDQHQHNLHPKKRVLDELWDDYPTYPEQRIRSILGSFLFSGEDVEKIISNLSGGEKARLALTKLAMSHDNFLILDEPTNHLDIDSREVLEKALINFDGTILFISHDRYFINKLATEIVELSDKGTQTYLGNYNYYIDKKEEQLEIAQHKAEQQLIRTNNSDNKPIKSQNQKQFIVNKEQQKLHRQLKRETEQLERKIEQYQTQKDHIEQQMINPENLQDIQKLNELQKQLSSINQQLKNTEDTWENVMIQLEDSNSSN